MSIIILVGGGSEQGNAEHRYLVGQFLQRFGDQVLHVVTTRPRNRPISTRIRRMIRNGNYTERLLRALYGRGYGPAANDVQQLLLPGEAQPLMPGGDKVTVVPSHNGEECRELIQKAEPCVIVVYGTTIIHEPVFTLARVITLNMHTGLSPYYRGDSTLFWPVYHNDPDHLGVTVHKLAKSVDGGDIAATARVVYSPGDTEADLFAKAVIAGTSLYLETVERALEGTLQCTPQDLSLGREYSWKDRTVAAERQVTAQLVQWESRLGSRKRP